jgi:hypothetical protein
MVSDKNRYKTEDPFEDFPALGLNKDLKPLNKTVVRHQLGFMDCDSITDRERAVKILLDRITDYYQVIGYVGPMMSGSSEIGISLGGWCEEKNMSPWRESFCTNNKYTWENPEYVFNRVRFACFESSLLLAAWEISLEVPESSMALKKAAWLARNTLRELSDRQWSEIRNRYGSKSMRKQLQMVNERINEFRLCESSQWLGKFIQKEV